jgi:hypothetical protein
MSENEAPPKVAAPHRCSGPSCDFCEWSNPTLEIPEIARKE